MLCLVLSRTEKNNTVHWGNLSRLLRDEIEATARKRMESSPKLAGKNTGPPAVEDSDEHYKDGGEWLTAKRLKERYCVPDSRLNLWRDDQCPKLNGRKWRAKLIKGIWCYHYGDLNTYLATLDKD